SRIVHQTPERLGAEVAIADVLVPIDTAPEWPLRIVQVKQLQAIEPHDAAELLERVGVSFRRADVVARREQMARVQTDADSRRSLHVLDHRRQLLERPA